MSSGFEPGRIYELVYPAENPVLVGLGLAATRDFIAFLKYGGALQDGSPAQGLGSTVRRAIGFGTSQSGRFLRTFLYYGFNQDEGGRPVFDGVLSHVAGASRGQLQPPVRPALSGRPLLHEHLLSHRHLPLCRSSAAGPRKRPQPGGPRPQPAAGIDPEDLLHQRLVRILREGRLPDSHQSRRRPGCPAGRKHPGLCLRRHPARSRLLSTAKGEHGQPAQSQRLSLAHAGAAAGLAGLVGRGQATASLTISPASPRESWCRWTG